MSNEVPQEFIQWCKDGDWIRHSYSTLMKLYENKIIAVRNYEVLMTDTNEMRLVGRLQKKFGAENTYNIRRELIRKYIN